MTPAELLRRHPLARDLSEPQLAALAGCARLVRLPARHLIFREGGQADALYLLLEGHVVLEQHVPGKGDVQLESLTGGDVLGLSWLFPEGHWIIDARTAEPSELLVLDARCLHARMDADTDLGLAIARQLLWQIYQRLERVRLQRLDVYRGEP